MTPRARKVSFSVAAAAALGALLLTSGVIPLRASSGHSAPVAWLLHFAFQRSVATHSIGIDAPKLDDPRLVQMGAGHYDGGCRPCHGAPGARRPRIPLAMTPTPPTLLHHVRDYDDAELFYIVRHGVKFTGMPAWPAPSRDDEVWAVVAFLRVLPRLDARAYERLVHGEATDDASASGAPRIVALLCARCHGVDGLGRDHGAFPRLAGQRLAYLEASMQAYANGARHSGTMGPIAADLGRAEMREAIRWYARLPPPTGGGATDDRGRAIARAGLPEHRVPPCAPCHGPRDEPHRPTYPRLAGQHAAYLEQQLRLFTQRARGGTEYAELMRVVTLHSLPPREIAAVARYYASLPGRE